MAMYSAAFSRSRMADSAQTTSRAIGLAAGELHHATPHVQRKRLRDPSRSSAERKCGIGYPRTRHLREEDPRVVSPVVSRVPWSCDSRPLICSGRAGHPRATSAIGPTPPNARCSAAATRTRHLGTLQRLGARVAVRGSRLVNPTPPQANLYLSVAARVAPVEPHVTGTPMRGDRRPGTGSLRTIQAEAHFRQP